MTIGLRMRAPLGRLPFFIVAATALLGLGGGPLDAQSFFANPVTDPVVGADRGSASQIRKLDENTGFLTLTNTGTEESGPLVLGFGYAFPNLVRPGDQFDVAAIWAGPSDDGWRELLAGGLSYRFPTATEGLTGFVNLDVGDLILGTADALALDVRGDRVQVSAGVAKTRDLGDTATLRFGAEVIARRTRSEVLGTPAIDEDLRMVRGSVLYSKGRPLGVQHRLALSVTKGFDAFGASPSGNPLGSTPGARTDFLRAAFAAETSRPFGPDWVLNMGVIGQWSDDSLPASQRCGFETNNYARAFDYALVAGDRCLGSRVEVAYNFQSPDLRRGSFDSTQGFIGIDGGRISNNANALSAGGSDGWASLSVGVRTLQGSILAEVAATRILDRPTVATGQDRDRLWVRAAYQF